MFPHLEVLVLKNLKLEADPDSYIALLGVILEIKNLKGNPHMLLIIIEICTYEIIFYYIILSLSVIHFLSSATLMFLMLIIFLFSQFVLTPFVELRFQNISLPPLLPCKYEMSSNQLETLEVSELGLAESLAPYFINECIQRCSKTLKSISILDVSINSSTSWFNL